MRRGLRGFENRTVRVHTPPPGPSLQGVLVRAHKDCLILGQATHLDSEEQLAGETVVPVRAGVFFQVVGSLET